MPDQTGELYLCHQMQSKRLRASVDGLTRDQQSIRWLPRQHLQQLPEIPQSLAGKAGPTPPA